MVFLGRKEFALPLARVVDVLEFPAFALQAVDLMLEVSFLVLEVLVRAFEAVVLSLEDLMFVLELGVLTLESLHIVLNAPFASTAGFEFIDKLPGRRSGTRFYDETNEVRY